jgi:hypothetical protein
MGFHRPAKHSGGISSFWRVAAYITGAAVIGYGIAYFTEPSGKWPWGYNQPSGLLEQKIDDFLSGKEIIIHRGKKEIHIQKSEDGFTGKDKDRTFIIQEKDNKLGGRELHNDKEYDTFQID